MTALTIVPDAETSAAMPDLRDRAELAGVTVAGLSHGTAGGKPSVFIVLTGEDGEAFAFAQTTLALFLSAAEALKATHGDPRE